MKRGKFSSHQIITNQAMKLVAQKLLNNINFSSNIEKKRSNAIKESNHHFEKYIEFFNASDIMRNFFTGEKQRKNFLRSSTQARSETRNTRSIRINFFNSFNSNKIAREVSSEKSSSGVEYMVNRSIDHNRIDKRNSSVLGHSILDLSMSKGRLGFSKQRKKTESPPLRYEDYVNRKSNSLANSSNIADLKKHMPSVLEATDVLFVERRYDRTRSKESMNKEYSLLVGSGKHKSNVKIAKLKAKTKISKAKNFSDNNSKEKVPTQKKKISSFHSNTFSGKKTTGKTEKKIKIDINQQKKKEVTSCDKNTHKTQNQKDKIGEAIQSTLPPKEEKDSVPFKISITQPPEVMPSELIPKENDSVIVQEKPSSNHDNRFPNFVEEEEVVTKKNSNTVIDVDINGDSADEGNTAINTVYKANPIFSINDIHVKNEIPTNEEPLKNYNEIIKKFLFSGNPILDEFNSSCISNKSLGESRLSNFDKDIDSITSTKQQLKNIKKYYTKEVKRMESLIQRIEDANITELENIRAKKENEMKSLKEKIKTEGNTGDTFVNSSNTNSHLKKSQLELDTLKSNLALKEKNYKNTIKTLLDELRSVSNKNLSLSNNFISGYEKNLNRNLKDSVMKEATDLLHSKEEISKDEVTVENNKLGEGYNEDSMMLELKEFKEDDSANYKFEIPLKYHMSKSIKVENEETRNGRLFKFYENSVVEIIHKNQTLTRLFPDGYSITLYKNKDIKQTFPNGTTVLFYFKNKSTEFSIPSGGLIAYKFKNGQFEKHFFDGRKYIKFSDGTIKIIRPNGEELNQFIDLSIQRKDKNGLITLTKEVQV